MNHPTRGGLPRQIPPSKAWSRETLRASLSTRFVALSAFRRLLQPPQRPCLGPKEDGNSTVRGLYFSTNDGVSWNRATLTDGAVSASNTAVIFNSANAMFYASISATACVDRRCAGRRRIFNSYARRRRHLAVDQR